MANRNANWRQVAACLVLQGVSAGTITSAFSVLAVPLAAEFQTTRMVVMLAMTVTLLATGILSPIAGSRMDRSSIRLLMAIGTLGLVVGFAGLSVTTGFAQVLIIYGLLLAPANVLIGPLAASVLLSRWFDKDRGRALGIAAIGISAGGFLFPPFMQFLIDSYGWRPALQILALLLLVLAGGAWTLVSDRPAGADRPAAITPGSTAATALSTRQILGDRDFWLMTGIFAVLLTGMMGLVTNMVPLAQDQGISLAMATLLISILSIGSLCGKIVFATVADRVDARVLLLIGLAGFSIGMACFWAAETGFWVMAFGAGIVGLCNGSAVPLQTVLVARVFGLANVGRIVGLLNLVIVLGGLAIPPLFGLIFDRTGTYDGAFLLYLGLAVIALLLTRGVRTQPAVAVA